MVKRRRKSLLEADSPFWIDEYLAHHTSTSPSYTRASASPHVAGSRQRLTPDEQEAYRRDDRLDGARARTWPGETVRRPRGRTMSCRRGLRAVTPRRLGARAQSWVTSPVATFRPQSHHRTRCPLTYA